MKQKKPFNQFEIPKPDRSVKGWFRRNIIVDHPCRTIWIQVMWDASGELSYSEYNYIVAGAFWQYIPVELVQSIRDGIGSGYEVRPMCLAGSPVGENHTVLQIILMTDDRHMIKDSSILKPVSDG